MLGLSACRSLILLLSRKIFATEQKSQNPVATCGDLFNSKTMVWTLECSDVVAFSEPSKRIFAMAIFEICMMLGSYAWKKTQTSNWKYPTMRLAIRHHSLYLRCHQRPVRPDCCLWFGVFVCMEVRIKLAAPSLPFHCFIAFHHLASCLAIWGKRRTKPGTNACSMWSSRPAILSASDVCKADWGMYIYICVYVYCTVICNAIHAYTCKHFTEFWTNLDWQRLMQPWRIEFQTVTTKMFTMHTVHTFLNQFMFFWFRTSPSRVFTRASTSGNRTCSPYNYYCVYAQKKISKPNTHVTLSHMSLCPIVGWHWCRTRSGWASSWSTSLSGNVFKFNTI